MKDRFLRAALCAAAVAALSSCAATNPEPKFSTPGVRNPSDALALPPDLSPVRQSGSYTYTQKGGAVTASGYGSSLGQGQAQVLPRVSNMRIEREGNIRWLVITGKSPTEVWPMLQAFWQENGFVVQKQEPEIGYMETQWAENRAAVPQDFLRNLLTNLGLGGVYSSDMRDKFITRVETAGNGETMVTFVHRGMKEEWSDAQKNTTKWVPRDSDPALEAHMLARFMMRLGADEQKIRSELSPRSDGASSASIVGDSVVIRGDGARNRHRLRLALERVGLTPLSVDSGAGTFLVQPQSAETAEAYAKKNKSFFGGIFGSSKKAEPKAPQPRLLVRIAPGPDGDVVRVSAENGSPLPPDRAKSILESIWNELR